MSVNKRQFGLGTRWPESEVRLASEKLGIDRFDGAPGEMFMDMA